MFYWKFQNQIQSYNFIKDQYLGNENIRFN